MKGIYKGCLKLYSLAAKNLQIRAVYRIKKDYESNQVILNES